MTASSSDFESRRTGPSHAQPEGEHAKTPSFARARDVIRAIGDRWNEDEPLAPGTLILDGYGRILAVSPDVAERLGFDAKRLVSRRLVHRATARTRGALNAALARVRASGEVQNARIELRTKGNEAVPATLTARSLTAVGSSVVVLATLAW